jgi:hypothetical protein
MLLELPPLPEIFGNYTIRGITEVLAPDAVSWLPQTTGWKLLLALLIITLARWGWRRWRLARHNRYRRLALAQLDQLVQQYGHTRELLNPLSSLLKATALQACSNREVAALSGSQWTRWLSDQTDSQDFADYSVQLLAFETWHRPRELPAEKVQGLVADSARWIASHRGLPLA